MTAYHAPPRYTLPASITPPPRQNNRTIISPLMSERSSAFYFSTRFTRQILRVSAFCAFNELHFGSTAKTSYGQIYGIWGRSAPWRSVIDNSISIENTPRPASRRVVAVRVTVNNTDADTARGFLSPSVAPVVACRASSCRRRLSSCVLPVVASPVVAAVGRMRCRLWCFTRPPLSSLSCRLYNIIIQ